MAHEYSVQIHDWITTRLKEIELKFKTAGQDDGRAYFQGQIRELKEIRKFLTEKIDLDTQKYYE